MTFINIPQSGGSETYKDPVSTAISLPTIGNTAGDIRVVLDTNSIVVWDASSSSWVSAIGGNSIVARFTIDAGTFASKSVTLGVAPTDPGSIQLVVIGGPDQNYLTDFSISGTVVSWGGLGLDGVIEIGDEIIISYS